MVLTEPGAMATLPPCPASPSARPSRLVSAMIAVASCACVVVLLAATPGPTEMLSKTQAVEAGEVGAVEHSHDVLVQKSKVLAAKIGDLARTLRRQETSLTGDGKVPKADLTAIKDDVESITRQWMQYKSAEHIPNLSKHKQFDDDYSKKLKTQQSELRNKAQAAFDKAERERVKSASLLKQAAKDDKVYKTELASEKKALAKLQAAKEEKAKEEAARKKAAIQRKIEAKKKLQRREEKQITDAVRQVQADAKKRAADNREEKENLRSWGMAAKAASRGDARAVGEFCEGQKSPAACRAALLTPSTTSLSSSSSRPCDPSSAGYLRCLGVRATGATMAGPSQSEAAQHQDLARLVAESGHRLMEDKTRQAARIRNHHLHNQNWMSA